MSTKSGKLNNVTVILKNARLSFPNLVTPKVTNGGKPRFQASFLLDPKDPEQKEQIKELKALCEKMATENFEKKVSSDRCCLRKGDDEDGNPRYEGYGGMWVVSATRANHQGSPALVDRKRNPLAEPAKELYAGCRVNVKINVYAQDYEGTKRINATLEVVQFWTNDEPFGNGPVTVDDMPAADTDDLDDEETETDDI